MMRKRIIAFLLMTMMAVSVCVFPGLSVHAEGTNDSERIQEAVAQFETDFPDADIRVVDGTVHVVVDELDMPQTRMTSVTSSAGGSFVDFNIPSYEVYRPYCHVYMNKSAVEAAKIQKQKPEVVEYILYEWAAGVAASTIVSLVKDKYGVQLDLDTVKFLCSNAIKFVGEFDRNSLIDAQNRSTGGKAYVVYGNYSNGVTFKVYGPWNGNTCTTYMGMNALTWKEKVYYNIYANF